jgi:hypothetical protein
MPSFAHAIKKARQYLIRAPFIAGYNVIPFSYCGDTSLRLDLELPILTSSTYNTRLLSGE